MGGALALADRARLPMADVRAGLQEVYDELLASDEERAPEA
jgi:hypothetical protein